MNVVYYFPRKQVIRSEGIYWIFTVICGSNLSEARNSLQRIQLSHSRGFSWIISKESVISFPKVYCFIQEQSIEIPAESVDSFHKNLLIHWEDSGPADLPGGQAEEQEEML